MNRTVVITGAGAGLGRTLARAISEKGDRLILLGRTLAKVQAVADELGHEATALECDVGSPDSVREAFSAIRSIDAKIDVLINNAAVYEPFLVQDAQDRQLFCAVETNFIGPFLTSREALPLMGRGAQVINISSESVSLEYPMLSLYQSTKAGMERFSSSLAKEVAARGIRVSVVRAGAMYDEDSTPPAWDGDAAVRFHQLCMDAGIDLRSRPSSHFRSASLVISQLLDLPADITIPFVQLEGFRA